MSGPFVLAWANILISRQKPDQPKCICRNILWYGSYIHTDTHPHALSALFWSVCLKKTTSWWQKGRELAVKLGYGMTVLVELEEERGEVDTYMVISSYYYNMLAINDTTWHMTQKKTWHHMMLVTCQLCWAAVLGRHEDMSSKLTFDDIENVKICSYVFWDDPRGCSWRCRGDRLSKLVHTLGLPWALTFYFEKYQENLQYPSEVSCRNTSPKIRWRCRFWMHWGPV